MAEARYPRGNDKSSDGRRLRPTHRKEKLLCRLPQDWQDRAWKLAIDAVEKSGVDYLPAFALTCGMGARALELTWPVAVGRDPVTGQLMAALRTAKARGQERDDPRTKGHLFPVNTEIGQYLCKMLEESGVDRLRIVPLPREKRQAYIMWVRRIGAKLRRQLETEGVMIDKAVLGEISANTYRHQWAANSKEALPLEKVAESMGHASALTASRYAKSTRAKGPYRPLAAYTNKSSVK